MSTTKPTAAEKEEQDQQRYEELLALSNQGDETVKTIGPWLTAEERVEINLLRCRIRKRRSRQRLRMLRSGIPVVSAIDEHVMEYRKQLEACIAEMRENYPTVLFGHMKSSRFSISAITYTKTVDLIRSAFFKEFHSRVKNTSFWKFSRVPGEMGEGRYRMYDAIDRVLQDLRIFDKTHREKWMNGKSAPSHLLDANVEGGSDGGVGTSFSTYQPNFFATLLFSPTRCEPTSSPPSPTSGSSSPPPPLNRIESCKKKYLECWSRFETELQQRLREQCNDNLCNFFSTPVFKPIEEPKSRTNWTNSWLCNWRLMNFRDLFFLKLSIYRLLVEEDRPLWDMLVDGCVFVPEKILLVSLRRLDRKLRSRRYRVPEPVRLLDAPMTPSNSCTSSSQSEPFEGSEFGTTVSSDAGEEAKPGEDDGDESEDGDNEEKTQGEEDDNDGSSADGFLETNSQSKDGNGEGASASFEIVREMMQHSSADETTMSDEDMVASGDTRASNEGGTLTSVDSNDEDEASIGVGEKPGPAGVEDGKVSGEVGDGSRSIGDDNGLDKNQASIHCGPTPASSCAGTGPDVNLRENQSVNCVDGNQGSNYTGSPGVPEGNGPTLVSSREGNESTPVRSGADKVPVRSGKKRAAVRSVDEQVSFASGDKRAPAGRGGKRVSGGRGNKRAATGPADKQACLGLGDKRPLIAPGDNRPPIAPGDNPPSFAAAFNRPPSGASFNQPAFDADHAPGQNRPPFGVGCNQSVLGASENGSSVSAACSSSGLDSVKNLRANNTNCNQASFDADCGADANALAIESQIDPGRNQPQFGSGHNQPQFGSGHNQPQVGASQNQSQINPNNNLPQFGFSHNQPQVGPGYNQPQVGPGYNQPQVGPVHNQPQVGPGYNQPQVGPVHNQPQVGPGYNQPPSSTAKNHSQSASSHNQLEFGTGHNRSAIYPGENSSSFRASVEQPAVSFGEKRRQFGDAKRQTEMDGGAAKRFKGGGGHNRQTSFYHVDEDDEEYESIQPSRSAASAKISKFFQL